MCNVDNCFITSSKIPQKNSCLFTTYNCSIFLNVKHTVKLFIHKILIFVPPYKTENSLYFSCICTFETVKIHIFVYFTLKHPSIPTNSLTVYLHIKKLSYLQLQSNITSLLQSYRPYIHTSLTKNMISMTLYLCC